MNTINPKLLTIIKGLPPKAKKGDKVAIDTEFFGMDKKRLHRPHGTFAYMGCSFDGQTVYWIDDESLIPEFMSRLEAGVWIMAHAKFDITQLRRYTNIPKRKNLWDVILIEQIQYSGYYNEFGLADLVRRYLDTYMPKNIREEFSDTVSLTDEQIGYASADVAYTWRVYQVQREKISEDDLRIYREIELPFLWVLLYMSGVRLDTEKWIALARKNEQDAKAIQDKYGHWGKEITGKKVKKEKDVWVGINLNSPAQVKAEFGRLGWHVKSTNVEVLDALSDECEFAKDMCVYRTLSKRSSTYGEKFVEDYVEADGKIYADIYQVGAETGRTSCRAPNLQNQPHESEYRECFICDDDEVMIVADWSAQEPKFAAYLSQDQGLIDALNGTEKLYIRVARDVLNIEIDKHSEEYKHMKSTVLGIFYGMSAKGLAGRIGVSEERAQEYIDAFLETYPGVKEYMRTQKRAKDYVQSVTGRKIWINKYSNQWERNVLNAPIQGSAADAMKIAAYRFLDNLDVWDTSPDLSPLKLLVHDEIAAVGNKKMTEKLMKTLEDAMISTANELHPGIRGSVEIFSGQNWACKS